MEKKKKRKPSGNSIVDQLRNIRSKVPISINTSFVSRVSLPTAETRRDKRVRFEEPDSLHSLPCEPNSFSRNVSRNSSPKGEEPKTSEFAFYKKLREDAAASSSHSYQHHKQHEQLEKSQPKTHAKDLSTMAKPNHVIGCFPPIEKGTPISFTSSISPKVSVNSGAQSGSENEHKDIFSIKRQKLLHFAMEALSLDVNKKFSTGFDLVSMLLQRLHPEKNAIAETTFSRSRIMCSDTKYNRKSKLHVSVESATPSDEISRPTRMSLISSLGMKNLLDSWPSKSGEYNVSEDVWKDMSTLLTWYPNNIPLEYEAKQPYNIIDYGAPSNLLAVRDSNFHVQPNKEFLLNRSEILALGDCGTRQPDSCFDIQLDDRGAPSNLLASRDSNFHVQPNEEILFNRSEILALGACGTRQPDSCFDIQLDEDFSSKRGEILALDYMPNSSNLISSTYQNLDYNSGLSEKLFDLNSMSRFKESEDVFCPNTLGTVSNQCNQFLWWGSSIMEKEQDFFSSTSGTQLQDTLQSGDCTVGITEVYYPSAQGIQHCSDITLGSMLSRKHLTDFIGRQSPEEREYKVEEPDGFLPLSCTPKYIGQEETCRFSSITHETSFYNSPPSCLRSGIPFQSQSSIDYDSDLQITGMDIKGDINEGERFMDSLLDGEDDTCRFEIPFSSPFLEEPSRMMASREMCYDWNGDYGGQLCLMDYPASAYHYEPTETL